MNNCGYYNRIPFQILSNVGLPNNYWDLTLDQQTLFDYIIKDNVRLSSEREALEEEMNMLGYELDECGEEKLSGGSDVY